MNSLIELAISSCAADCIEGLRIWAVILDWSKEHNPPNQTESLFCRMLGFPYQSLDGAMEQYKQWHEEQGTPVSNDIENIFLLAKKEYEDRDELETELAASIEMDHIMTTYNRFLDYVHFETQRWKKGKGGPVNRILFLYERYAYHFREVPEFWHSFFLFALDKIKLPRTLETVSLRALQHISYCGTLYEDRILALELGGKSCDKLASLVSEARNCSLSSSYDLLQLLLAALASYRRRTVLTQKDARSYLEAFCTECVDWLVGKYELLDSEGRCERVVRWYLLSPESSCSCLCNSFRRYVACN